MINHSFEVDRFRFTIAAPEQWTFMRHSGEFAGVLSSPEGPIYIAFLDFERGGPDYEEVLSAEFNSDPSSSGYLTEKFQVGDRFGIFEAIEEGGSVKSIRAVCFEDGIVIYSAVFNGGASKELVAELRQAVESVRSERLAKKGGDGWPYEG
jgi:hypothetical protein